MKNKNVVLIIVLLFLIIISGIGIYILIQKTNEINNENSEDYTFEWCSNYIWNDTSENDTWLCFRKEILVEDESDLKQVIARIAVDSKYWLYINGEIIVREGALKRSETRDSIYYDELDISKYLNVGENTIAVLVWYFGDTSFSHSSSGQGAFLFQARIGKEYIISDNTWKVKANPGYIHDLWRPNNRLIEYNIYYDAALADNNWYRPEYDDSSWEYASVLAPAGSPAWGTLIPRSIPQFKFSENIIEYVNMDDYRGHITAYGEVLEMILPYNAQLVPYFKIVAPEEGMKITIKTDTYTDINGDSIRYQYLTKNGIQEFEGLAWLNGEKVYYEIPEGIKIISLGYRETGYDSEMVGAFESDDEFLNKLWQMSRRTSYVNMRDSYMDCPNRERAQWTADMNLGMLQSLYSLDTNANALYEKGVRTIVGWRFGTHLLTVVPITGSHLHLPTQNLAGIYSTYEYYRYTGNKKILEDAYAAYRDYLDIWTINEKKNSVDRTESYGVWEWGDSSSEKDYKGLETMWYYIALDNVGKMAKILGYTEDYNVISERLTKVNEIIDKHWTKKGYKFTNDNFIDERVNTLAVISGIADTEKYDVIKRLLTKNYQATPYMEYYCLEALCKMGYITDAQERMKDRYDEMVNGEEAGSTLWEHWTLETGTKNHTWSGGPLVIMSKYFAGIEPLDVGYNRIFIKPQFGTLNSIFSKVCTIKGDILLRAERNESGIKILINVPTDTLIAIEKVSSGGRVLENGKLVYEEGIKRNLDNLKFDSEDEDYIYFLVKKGEYSFVSE